eukprot:gene17099-15164_t
MHPALRRRCVCLLLAGTAAEAARGPPRDAPAFLPSDVRAVYPTHTPGRLVVTPS